MAIVKSLAIGKSRGSIGDFTYTTIEGRTIARMKPSFVKKSNTPEQAIQRSKMAVVVQGWRDFGFEIERLFTVRKKYSSAYNQFVSMNIMSDDVLTPSLLGDSVGIKEGLIIGNGKFGDRSILGHSTHTNGYKVSCQSSELAHFAKIGDVIGVYGQLEGSTEKVMLSKVLDEEALAKFKALEPVIVSDFDEMLDTCATIYYSPSRNVSKTSIMGQFGELL